MRTDDARMNRAKALVVLALALALVAAFWLTALWLVAWLAGD